MVESDKNPSDARKQAIQQEKKIVVYSPRGKLSQKYLKNDLCRLLEYLIHFSEVNAIRDV